MELVRTWTGLSDRSRASTERSRKSHELEKLQPLPSGSNEAWLGHYNRLNETQQTALENFKAVLQEKGLYTPDPPSHDEPTLIRYLRARRWDIPGALAQFRETIKARQENRVDELYENVDVAIYEKARVLYPQFTGHRDRRGLPLYIYQIKHLDSKTVAQYTKDTATWKKDIGWNDAPAPAKLLPLWALYQNLLTLVLPLCSTLPRPDMDVPVTQCTNIVDISGVGIKTFWNLKNHMQEASQIANTHFPETLDRIFIIGAPYFFPTVWGWIKRWFDPNTVSKIFVLSQSETKATLERFFEPSSIPKAYGGELDWTYGDPPAMDPEIRDRVGHDWVLGPARWEGQYVPLGTENGKQRPRPDPIPEDQRPPLVQAAVVKAAVPAVLQTSDEKAADTADLQVANLTMTDLEKTPAPAMTTVENPAPAEISRVDIPEPPAEAEAGAETDAAADSPSKPVDLVGAALQHQQKATSRLNGVAKPGLERFDTAVEIVPNGMAKA